MQIGCVTHHVFMFAFCVFKLCTEILKIVSSVNECTKCKLLTCVAVHIISMINVYKLR